MKDIIYPKGEHICTIEEIEQHFLFTEIRKQKWDNFKTLFDRLIELGLKPKELIIDGSFVTQRDEPGDVDFAVLITPQTVRQALEEAVDDEDIEGIKLFINGKNQGAVRALFGAHLLLADNEFMLEMWSDLFRRGKNGKLREPDFKKDPEWVTTPDEKGILKVVRFL